MGRIKWYFNKSKIENKIDTIKRAKKLVDDLENLNDKRILLVTHGFFMTILAKELLHKKYKGNIDLRPKNGVLYFFEKNQSK